MKKRNYWMYAFITLVSVLVIFLLFLGTKIFSSPSEKYEVTSKIQNENSEVFKVTMNKKQANQMAEYYLKNTLNNGKTEYQFKVKDNAELSGDADFLGSKIHFVIVLKPYAKTNGDVLLKATKIKLGDISLPISFVLNYVNNMYNIPDWVSINSKDKTILMKFTEYKTKDGYGIRAKKIDLKNDVLKFDMFNSKITGN
ncbi:YpmS family protein [Companilactobacillus metriopterae]|uniref:YpmS family protein n=1 Tax=Companilactobacillus metriopterae TaxID=1909267 RepID=UPI00100A5E06|nr:YpmS family protein [Companilactobacillus metriopterae]